MDETSVHNNYSFLNYDNISCEMQPEPRNLKLEGTDWHKTFRKGRGLWMKS